MSRSLQQEEALFSSALALPDEERGRFLDCACGSDRALRKRVEDLLTATQSPGDLLSLPFASQPPGSTFEWLDEEREGERIGPYTLLQQIGEGGCGVVYRAEQSEPLHRQVALKIIKVGMDTRAVIARFQAERQVLAMMDHPGIAKVHDAGSTPTGRPYFVMELVRGVKITDYCNQCRLTPDERIQIVVQVCLAVQHAHSKGVIHRDIKPSNILVTLHDGAPLAKVIDFGVAKATQGRLTDHTHFTALDQFVGTPAYMSPEQTYPGGEVDAQSDIYSLGVLLYELLTGRLPFDGSGSPASQTAEIKQKIRAHEPPRPSHRLRSLSAVEAAQTQVIFRRSVAQLSNHLARDLDWIVLRCLEKEPAQRYGTAVELAQDLERCLRHEPVLARPHTAFYALSKLARRHRTAAGALAAFVLVLIGAAVVSTWLAVRAMQAERQARLEAASREQVIKFLRDDLLAQAGPDEQPDPDVKLRTVLDRAAAKTRDRFNGQPLIEANVQLTLATTYDALGEYAKALGHYKRVVELRREHLGEDHPETLKAMAFLVSVMIADSQYEAAEPLAKQTLERQTRVLGAEHTDTLAHAGNVALLYYQRGKFADMAALLRRILPIQQQRLGEAHQEALTTMNNLAIAYRNQGEYEEAARLHAQELAICRKSLGPEHPDTLTSMNNLANTLSDLGRFREALELNREAFAISRRTTGENHPETLVLQHNLATNHREVGDFKSAQRMQEDAVARMRKAFGPTHSNTIKAEGMLGVIYRDRGKLALAAQLQQTALERARRTYGETNPIAILTAAHLAQTYQEQGRLLDAEEILRAEAPRAAEIFGADGAYTMNLNDQLAAVLIERNEFAGALELLRTTTPRRERDAPNHWRTLNAQSLMGAALAGDHAYEAAERLLLNAYERLLFAPTPAHEARLRERTGAALVKLYDAWNKPVQAAHWRSKLPNSTAMSRVGRSTPNLRTSLTTPTPSPR